jgi:hypothetical protein
VLECTHIASNVDIARSVKANFKNQQSCGKRFCKLNFNVNHDLHCKWRQRYVTFTSFVDHQRPCCGATVNYDIVRAFSTRNVSVFRQCNIGIITTPLSVNSLVLRIFALVLYTNIPNILNIHRSMCCWAVI